MAGSHPSYTWEEVIAHIHIKQNRTQVVVSGTNLSPLPEKLLESRHWACFHHNYNEHPMSSLYVETPRLYLAKVFLNPIPQSEL